jgi:hypothetical protein
VLSSRVKVKELRELGFENESMLREEEFIFGRWSALGVYQSEGWSNPVVVLKVVSLYSQISSNTAVTAIAGRSVVNHAIGCQKLSAPHLPLCTT